MSVHLSTFLPSMRTNQSKPHHQLLNPKLCTQFDDVDDDDCVALLGIWKLQVIAVCPNAI